MSKTQMLEQAIIHDINSSKLRPGCKLPTERSLCEIYQISRQTVRQALSNLVSAGYIYTVHGSGSYVAEVSPVSKKQYTKQISVIVPYMDQMFFPLILQRIEEIATEKDYSVNISTTNYDLGKERTILEHLLESPPDGVIVEATKSNLPNPNLCLYRKLLTLEVPLVFINNDYGALHHPLAVSVLVDDYTGGKNSAKKLIGCGHTNIGTIMKLDDRSSMIRYSGILDALFDNKSPLNDHRFVFYETKSKEYWIQNIGLNEKMLTSCTALICASDEISYNLLPYLSSHTNHTVQELISFGGAHYPYDTRIKYHSYEYPAEALGRISATKLFNMIAGYKEESMKLSWK